MADSTEGRLLNIRWTPLFRHDYQRLPQDVQSRADKAIRFLQINFRHPSLQSKKMHGAEGTWEARVSSSYRITFELDGDTLILRRISPHDILRNETS